MVVVPHPIEHNCIALVDCLLVQPLFTTGSEQFQEVIPVEAADQVFCDVTLSPRQARFVRTVCSESIRSLEGFKVLLNSGFD
jgi:hypothetical protein